MSSPFHPTRRALLIGAGAATVAACGSRDTDDAADRSSSFQAFVWGDAHMGWSGKDQPDLATQLAAARHIRERFPKLNMLVDCGDAHHGDLTGEALQQAQRDWLQLLREMDLPVFYVPGNHELNKGLEDPELRTVRCASLACRPYYAWSMHGLHFVALPQLVDTIWVSDETLAWLELDLSLHRDQTTFVFAHNAIAGTTFDNGETAYRRLLNSDRVVELLDRHPQVVAWLHGHNHLFEVVRRATRDYVSVGRMGGFKPGADWGDFGQGHLGGFLLTVDANGYRLQGYSATAQAFFSELAIPAADFTVEARRPTSFSSVPGWRQIAGVGAAVPGTPYQLTQRGDARGGRLFAASVSTATINDNADFNASSELRFAGRKRDRIVGIELRGARRYWDHDDGKLTLKPGQHRLELPFHRNLDGEVIRGSYFNCAPGQRYELSVSTRGGANKPGLAATLFDDKLMPLSDEVGVADISHAGVVKYLLTIPQHTQASVRLHLALDWNLMAPLVIDAISIKTLDLNQATSPGLAFGNKVVAAESSPRLGLDGQVLVRAVDNRVSWLWRSDPARWLARNAIVRTEIGGLHSIEPGNEFAEEEIVLNGVGAIEGVMIKRIRGLREGLLRLRQRSDHALMLRHNGVQSVAVDLNRRLADIDVSGAELAGAQTILVAPGSAVELRLKEGLR